MTSAQPSAAGAGVADAPASTSAPSTPPAPAKESLSNDGYLGTAYPGEVLLPGVLPEADDVDEPASGGNADADGVPAPVPPPAGEGLSGADPAAPAPVAPAATTPKFKFGGEEWDSQEKAEQSFKTLRGQYKAWETKVRQSEADSRAHHQSAQAWKQHAEQLQERLNQSEKAAPLGSTSSAGAAAPSAETKSLAESINWQLYNQIHEDHGAAVAQFWLTEQMVPALRKEIEASLAPTLQPFRDNAAMSAVQRQAVDLFETVGTYVNSDGSEAYPELKNADTAEQIGYLWHEMGLPPEFAMTPQGIHLAVLLYRSHQQQTGVQSNQPPAQPNGATPGDAALAALAAAANAGAGAVTQPGQQPRVAGGAQPDALSSLRAGIREARDFRGNLGFTE